MVFRDHSLATRDIRLLGLRKGSFMNIVDYLFFSKQSSLPSLYYEKFQTCRNVERIKQCVSIYPLLEPIANTEPHLRSQILAHQTTPLSIHLSVLEHFKVSYKQQYTSLKHLGSVPLTGIQFLCFCMWNNMNLRCFIWWILTNTFTLVARTQSGPTPWPCAQAYLGPRHDLCPPLWPWT